MKPAILYLRLITVAIAVASIQCNPTADDRDPSPSQVNLSSEQRELVKIVDNLEERLPENGLGSLVTALAADMLEERGVLSAGKPNRCWALQTSAQTETSIPFEASSSCSITRPAYDRDIWISLSTYFVNALQRRRSYVMDFCSNYKHSHPTQEIEFLEDMQLRIFRNHTCGRYAIDSHRTRLSILDRTISFSLIKADDPSKCLTYIDEVPKGSDRKSIDKLQLEPCENIRVKENQKFTIRLTDTKLKQLIETLEFQTTFHEAWTEHCKVVKPGSGAHDRICVLKNTLERLNEGLRELAKPIDSLFFNATTKQLNQALVADAMSAGFSSSIESKGPFIKMLKPTMTGKEGGIRFELEKQCDNDCHSEPFEWTSFDMRLSYIFGQDKHHRLDLCAKLSSNTTNGKVEFARISALGKSKQLGCAKLALGKNIIDGGVLFQIIQVDEPNKCLTRFKDSESLGSESSEPIEFRFETCQEIGLRSTQVFEFAERSSQFSSIGDVRSIISNRMKNFWGPMFGLQYLSLEHNQLQLSSEAH